MTPTMEEVAGWLREAAVASEMLYAKTKDQADDRINLFFDRASQVEAMGWRPIEESTEGRNSLIDLWDGVDSARIPDCKWVSGRFVYFDGQWEEWLECCDATHFMPLPQPLVKK